MIYKVAAEHGLSEQRSAEILERKYRTYESLEHTLSPVSGAIEFVHWAKSRYRLALATSATGRNREATPLSGSKRAIAIFQQLGKAGRPVDQFTSFGPY
jgi:beta-phosphoglucomutase-like phosphatase (HAD superfamily)